MGISLKGFTKPTVAGTGGLQGLSASPPASSAVRLPGGFGGGTGIPDPVYRPAVSFDGTSAYMRPQAALGSTGPTVTTGSVWLYPKSGFLKFFSGEVNGSDIANYNTKFQFDSANMRPNWVTLSSTSQIVGWMRASTTVGGLVQNTWQHIAWTYDSNNINNCRMYYNGVEVVYDQKTINTPSANIGPWGGSNMVIGGYELNGGSVGGLEPFDVCDFWMDPSLIDLTISTNMEKFIKDGKAVDLTADGSGPKGTPPVLFLTGGSAEWGAGANQGTGTNFNTFGSITNASQGPEEYVPPVL